MSENTPAAEDELRSIDDVEPGSQDLELFRALHAIHLPRHLVYTADREEQLAQVRWLLHHGQTLQSWSLAQLYWDEQAPLGTFVRTHAPSRLTDIAATFQADPITRISPQ